MTTPSVRAARQARGFTQEYVAGAVGITPPSLSHIENGRRRPSAQVALRLWRVLGADLALLPIILGDMPEAQPQVHQEGA